MVVTPWADITAATQNILCDTTLRSARSFEFCCQASSLWDGSLRQCTYAKRAYAHGFAQLSPSKDQRSPLIAWGVNHFTVLQCCFGFSEPALRVRPSQLENTPSHSFSSNLDPHQTDIYYVLSVPLRSCTLAWQPQKLAPSEYLLHRHLGRAGDI